MGGAPCRSVSFCSSCPCDRFSRLPSVPLCSWTECLILSQAPGLVSPFRNLTTGARIPLTRPPVAPLACVPKQTAARFAVSSQVTAQVDRWRVKRSLAKVNSRSLSSGQTESDTEGETIWNGNGAPILSRRRSRQSKEVLSSAPHRSPRWIRGPLARAQVQRMTQQMLTRTSPPRQFATLLARDILRATRIPTRPIATTSVPCGPTSAAARYDAAILEEETCGWS
jgi:hypothetical protein